MQLAYDLTYNLKSELTSDLSSDLCSDRRTDQAKKYENKDSSSMVQQFVCCCGVDVNYARLE